MTNSPNNMNLAICSASAIVSEFDLARSPSRQPLARISLKDENSSRHLVFKQP
ncbi:hypothetical protein F2Q69_00027930 [Brassica cretica]|uniref:Uncharacterized protein n=1 Tax=Brassica cretica TaxID=69181 RepID=A0A8S9RSI8_BRACR|nr:hypothetical protein F2Q69_00027930 [Brassica cretica]